MEVLDISSVYEDDKKEIILIINYDEEKMSIFSHFEVGYKDENGDIYDYNYFKRNHFFINHIFKWWRYRYLQLKLKLELKECIAIKRLEKY